MTATPVFRRTALWALTTVGVGLASWFLWDRGGPPDITLGPLETITGVPFPTDEQGIVVTEPLAHVRVPFSRSRLGKHLVLTARFRLESADVLEVGIRKSDFWLDVEREPLQHRLLDRLSEPERGWIVLHAPDEMVLLNPAYPVPASSVKEFLNHPPSDGVIGLYGNTSLPCAKEGGNCTAGPFRISDTPARFRAIYARYTPPRPTDGARERTIVFPLDRAYQNPDGSFDLMLFQERADGGPVRTVIETVNVRSAPAAPDLRALLARARAFLRAAVLRPPPPR